MTLEQFLVRSGRYVSHKKTAEHAAQFLLSPEDDAEQDRMATINVQKYWSRRAAAGRAQLLAKETAYWTLAASAGTGGGPGGTGGALGEHWGSTGEHLANFHVL